MPDPNSHIPITVNAFEVISRLKSEVARLQNNCDYLDRKLDEEIDKSAALAGEIARLRKAGTEMGKHLPDTDEANKAYNDFENGGQYK